MKKALSLVLAITLSLSLCSCGKTTTSFDIAYSPEGIEQFLKTVCKNVDGDAKVIDPDYDGPAGGSCYTARIEVKLTGKVADEVQMRFYNSNSSDKVSWAQVIFYSFTTGNFGYVDYEHVFNCEKEFVMALERTLAGKTYVDEYLTTYYEVQKLVLSPEARDTVTIAEYQLTDKLMVTINVSNFVRNGHLYYIIRNIPEKGNNNSSFESFFSTLEIFG